MRGFLKKSILFVIDAVTLYLSYYVSSLVLQIIDIPATGIEQLISSAYIFVAIKLVIYLTFFLYSLKRYRSFLLDILGIIIANSAAVFAAQYLYQISIRDNIVYYGIVVAFDLLIGLMVRYLMRTSDYEDYEYDEDDDDKNMEASFTLGSPTEEVLYNDVPLQANYTENAEPVVPIKPIEPDPELIRKQQEKDQVIEKLTKELEEKEKRIEALEDKITMQSNFQYDDFLPSESYAETESYADSYQDKKTYIDRNKKEILDTILDDIKSLYMTLNDRTKVLEEREYNLLLKMVELEEKERALEEIQRANRYALPERRNKYQRKKTSRDVFSPILSLPSDNPNLAKNILKTIEELEASTLTPPITFASPVDDEPHRPRPSRSTNTQRRNPATQKRKVYRSTERTNTNKQSATAKNQANEAPHPTVKRSAKQTGPNENTSKKSSVDFDTMRTPKVDLKPEELDDISSVIDTL